MARFGFLATILSVALSVLAVPLNATLGDRADGLSPLARDILLTSRAVPTTRWVAYFDRFVSSSTLPSTASLSGFNVFALAFIYSSSLQDNAALWNQFDATTRANIKSQYAAAGISLIVSAFGAGPVPTSAGEDPTASANFIADFVIRTGLDGVDVDYEDFGAIENSAAGVNWLVTFTRQLRSRLPAGKYILTHAPVAPWFSPNIWPGNGYLAINQQVGSLIDWYNIQFYNQGVNEYTTCDNLLTASSSQWPQSAVFQIAANGVPLNKIVIGKPATAGDASNGLMSTSVLSSCLAQAKAKGWSAGAMTWQYPNADSAWIKAVRAGSFPVSGGGGGGGGGGGTTTPPSTTTTTPPSGGSCSGVAAWNSSTAYDGGSRVTFNGALWTASWWNFNEQPGGASGAWARTSTCSSAVKTAAKQAGTAAVDANTTNAAAGVAHRPTVAVADAAEAKATA